MPTSPESSALEGLHLEPKIVQIGDMTIMGVRHDTHLTDDAMPSEAILAPIKQADHLIMEGDGSVSKKKLSYEAYAASEFEKRGKAADIHFLDTGVDLSALVGQYGMSPEYHFRNFFSFLAADALIGQEVPDGNIDELLAFRDDLIPSIAEQSRFTGNLPEADGIKLAGQVVDLHIELRKRGDYKTVSDLNRASIIEGGFNGRIRDYEVYLPKIQELDRSLDGKKTLIVGMAHVKALKYGLETGSLPKPPTWQEYVRSQGRSDRKVIEVSERAFQGRKIKPWHRL